MVVMTYSTLEGSRNRTSPPYVLDCPTTGFNFYQTLTQIQVYAVFILYFSLSFRFTNKYQKHSTIFFLWFFGLPCRKAIHISSSLTAILPRLKYIDTCDNDFINFYFRRAFLYAHGRSVSNNSIKHLTNLATSLNSFLSSIDVHIHPPFFCTFPSVHVWRCWQSCLRACVRLSKIAVSP